MIPNNMIEIAFNVSIKKLTTLRTLTDAINKSDIYKGMLIEVDKYILLFL